MKPLSLPRRPAPAALPALAARACRTAEAIGAGEGVEESATLATALATNAAKETPATPAVTEWNSATIACPVRDNEAASVNAFSFS